VACHAKHTVYQPKDEDWKCPKCGANNEHFTIIDPTPEADGDCVLLHATDECECTECGYGGAGVSVARALMKKENLVPCPHCKGRGVVQKTGG
jgi:Zn finger protein HypA/HybF involved in hydrogenase expression